MNIIVELSGNHQTDTNTAQTSQRMGINHRALPARAVVYVEENIRSKTKKKQSPIQSVLFIMYKRRNSSNQYFR